MMIKLELASFLLRPKISSERGRRSPVLHRWCLEQLDSVCLWLEKETEETQRHELLIASNIIHPHFLRNVCLVICAFVAVVSVNIVLVSSLFWSVFAFSLLFSPQHLSDTFPPWRSEYSICRWHDLRKEIEKTMNKKSLRVSFRARHDLRWQSSICIISERVLLTFLVDICRSSLVFSLFERNSSLTLEHTRAPFFSSLRTTEKSAHYSRVRREREQGKLIFLLRVPFSLFLSVCVERDF